MRDRHRLLTGILVIIVALTAAYGVTASDGEQTSTELETNADEVRISVTVGSYGEEASLASNDTADIWVGAVTDDRVQRPVSNVTINVTVTDPDGDEVTTTVETTENGNAYLEYNLTDRSDGRYSISVESDATDERDFEQFVAGQEAMVTTEASRSAGTFLNEETDIAVRVLDGGQPVANATVELEITAPDGNVTGTVVKTDSNGYDTVTVTPDTPGTHVISGDGMTINTEIEVAEYLAELQTENQYAGENASIAGYVFGNNEPYRGNLTLRVFDGRQWDDPVEVLNMTTATDIVGLFVAEFEAPEEPGGYYLALETDDGDSVPIGIFQESFYVTEPPSDDGSAPSGAPRLMVNYEDGYDARFAPGDDVPFEIRAIDEEGEPIANESVSVQFQYGFNGPPVGSVDVTTNVTGAATGSISLPDEAPLGEELRTTGVMEYENETITGGTSRAGIQEHFVSVGTPEAPIEPGSDVEIPVSVTDTDGTPIEGETYTFETQPYLIQQSFETASVTTDENGEGSFITSIPSDLDELMIASGGTYSPEEASHTSRWSHQSQTWVSLAVDQPDVGLDLDKQEATPGETVTASFNNTNVTKGLVKFTTFSDPGAEYEVVEAGETVEFTIPESAADGDWYSIDVFALDDNRTRYDGNEYVRVSDPEDNIIPQINVEPAEPDVGEQVTFNASDSIGDIVDYEWDFGDGVTKKGENVSHSFDEIGTYEVELTVTDSSGTTATATESVSVGGHVAIEHGDGASTSSNGLYADVPVISTSRDDQTIDVGGESNTGFWITNTDTNESVTVTLNESTEPVSAESISFFLYNASGAVRYPSISTYGPNGLEERPVDVKGDLELFENESTFSAYEVALADANESEPISTTGERIMGIGYEAELQQNGTDGEIDVTIPRNEEINESWNVTFGLHDSETGEILTEKRVENDAATEYFQFTIDATVLDAGEHTWVLTVDTDGQDTHIQQLHETGDFVVSDEESAISIEPNFTVSDTTPTAGDTVTFNASDAVAFDGNEEIEFDGYSWDFDDGTTAQTNDSVVDHTFEEAGEYNVTVTFYAGNETESDTQTVTVSEPVDPAFFAVGSLKPENATVEQGDVINVSATLTNTGEEKATQEVEFRLDNGVLETESVTLGAGASETVTFENIDTTEFEPAEYTYGVFSADDEQTTALTVTQPAFFTVELEQYDDVTAGDNVSVSAIVENTGDNEGTKNLTLTIDEEVVDSQSVRLAAGQNESVDLMWETNDDDIGTSELTVGTEDASASSEVTVYAPSTEAFFDVETLDAPDEVLQGDNVEVNATLKNFGGTEATQNVTLTIDGETEDSKLVTLAGNASTELTLTWNTSDAASGNHEIGVETVNDTETTSVTVHVPDDPSFDVDIVDDETNGSVAPGGELTVTATVTNTGDLNGTQDIDFYVNDNLTAIEPDLELAPGSSAEVTFTFTVPEDFEEGGLTIAVESLDDRKTSTVTVEAPDNGGGFLPPPPSDDTVLLLGSIDAPDTVSPDESLTVSVTVENYADTTIDDDVWLEIDGSHVAETDVSIESDDLTTVEYDIEAPSTAGDYELTVNTAYGSASTTLTVEADDSEDETESDSETETNDSEADEDEETDEADTDENDSSSDETDADESDDNDDVVYEFSEGSPGFGLVSALLALLGAGYLLRVRTP